MIVPNFVQSRNSFLRTYPDKFRFLTFPDPNFRISLQIFPHHILNCTAMKDTLTCFIALQNHYYSPVVIHRQLPIAWEVQSEDGLLLSLSLVNCITLLAKHTKLSNTRSAFSPSRVFMNFFDLHLHHLHLPSFSFFHLPPPHLERLHPYCFVTTLSARSHRYSSFSFTPNRAAQFMIVDLLRQFEAVLITHLLPLSIVSRLSLSAYSNFAVFLVDEHQFFIVCLLSVLH